MSVGRFCTHQVMTVHPATTVRTAAERMAAENVGALVVLEGHKPVGILTDRDVVVRAIAQGYTPEATEVRAVMTSNSMCITEDAPLEGPLHLGPIAIDLFLHLPDGGVVPVRLEEVTIPALPLQVVFHRRRRECRCG